MKVSGRIKKIFTLGYERVVSVNRGQNNIIISFSEYDEFVENGVTSKFEIDDYLEAEVKVQYGYVIKEKDCLYEKSFIQDRPDSPYVKFCASASQILDSDRVIFLLMDGSMLETEFEDDVEIGVGKKFCVEGEFVAEHVRMW